MSKKKKNPLISLYCFTTLIKYFYISQDDHYNDATSDNNSIILHVQCIL